MCWQQDSCRDMKDTIQNGLKELWATGALSDVTLQADGREFQAHRALLAAASPFFMAMFSGVWAETRNQKPIELKAVTAVGLQFVLDFIYTGTMALEECNIIQVMMAADHLQVQPAIKYCADYIVTNNRPVNNCVDILNYSNMNKWQDLKQVARNLVAHNFQEVVKNKYHLDLDFDDFMYFLDGDKEGEDAIQFGPEVLLFYAVVDWIRHNRKRMKHLVQLMKAIRFPLMSAEDVERILYDHPFITENAACHDMITDFQNYNKKSIQERILDDSKNTVVRSSESVLITAPLQSGTVDTFTLSSHPQICSDPVEADWKPLKDFPGVDFDIANCQGDLCTVVVNGFLIVLIKEKVNDQPPNEYSPARLSARVFDPRKFEWSSLPNYDMDDDCYIIHTAVACAEDLLVFLNYMDELVKILIYSFQRNDWNTAVPNTEFSIPYSVCAIGRMVHVIDVKGDNLFTYSFLHPNTGDLIRTRTSFHSVKMDYSVAESYPCDGRILHNGVNHKLNILSFAPDNSRSWSGKWDIEETPNLPAEGVRVLCGNNLFSLANKADEPFTSELTLGRKFNKGGHRVIKHQGLPLDLERGCMAVAIRIPQNRLGCK